MITRDYFQPNGALDRNSKRLKQTSLKRQSIYETEKGD